MINSFVSRANEKYFSNYSNEFWNLIGKIFTANPKFKPSYYEGVYITRVWISLRKIGIVVDLGANHWGVVFKLSNGKYGITQFDTTAKIELLDNYNSLEAASLQTWGKGGRVRLSCYGGCHKNYINWIKSFYGRHTYVLGFHDCQNFAREIVEDLTGNWVGVWPKEDGPEFGRRNIDSLEEIADQAGPAVVFAAINPFYWIARALFD